MLHRTLVLLAAIGIFVGCGSDAVTPFVTPPNPDAGAVDVTEDTTPTDTGDSDTGADASDASSDAETDVPEADVIPPQPGAIVRLVHVSPDTPTLDVWIDGEPPADGSPWAGVERYAVVPEFGAAEPYIQFEDRQYRLDFVPEGGSLDDSLLSVPFNMTSGAIYTLWLGGVSGYDREIPEDHEELVLAAVVDDLGLPIDTETLEPRQRVRFIHSVIGAGNLDFTISGEKVDENLQFTWYSFDEQMVPLGEFTFGFSLAGEPEPLLSVPMEFGQWTTNVWAGGYFDEGEFWFITLSPDNEIERRLEIIPEFFDVRFVHASPLADASFVDGIDVYRGSDQLAVGTKFAEASAFVAVEAGRHRFHAFPFGADPELMEPIAEMGNRTYEAETTNTVVFYDDGAEGSGALVPHDADAPEDSLVFVHGGAGLGDISVTGLVDGLSLGDVSDPVSVSAGAAQFMVEAGGDSWVFETTLADSAEVVVLTNEEGATGGTAPLLLIVDEGGSVNVVSPAG